ncbi:hypothetical protein K474DRAFT_1775273 [Panus rudis PR-1116 ss-1]|nr:hypothetical protein K474DRAFT_1775273 [Panus rudis PR-1116 ss-1]
MASRRPTDEIRLVSNSSGAAMPGGPVEMTQMTLLSSSELPGAAPVSSNDAAGVAFVKHPGGKRKRLSKACDACHKSKRRCDGTAPCSNCYFASKDCTYTDSSGRPVPAPRNAHPSLGVDQPVRDSIPKSNATHTAYRVPVNTAGRPNPPVDVTASKGTRRIAEPVDNTVKRPRPEALGVNTSSTSPLGSTSSIESPKSSPLSTLLDPATTHELVNLFFTHCNPSSLIIHKPSFSSDLAHEQVPAYLVLAICANAAPHSKEVSAKAEMPRLAGVPFFQEAVSIMFDASFRLCVEPNVHTAQALCLLEMHEVAASHAWTKHYRYFDLALRILEESLDVAAPDNATSSPPGPSRAYHIERESIRRCFWLVQLMSWINGIYTFRPMRPRSVELMRQVRLPCDETSFELAVSSQVQEYMHTPGPRTKYASQFGHLCRVLSMYQTFESALATKQGPDITLAALEARRALDIWVHSLPDHLRFTEENLEKQISMFETPSNTGAWCFCFMHVLHPCLVLSLLDFRRQAEGKSNDEDTVDWVRNQLKLIFSAVGHRAKNTILSACALWSYSKYQPHDPQLQKWDDDFEKIWGFRVVVVANQWREIQARQRSQIGRSYPVDSISKRDSPPAFAVASDASSASSSTNSSPREPDAQYTFAQAESRSVVVADNTSNMQQTHGQGQQITRGYSPTSQGVLEKDLAAARAMMGDGHHPTSLPSLRTMGIMPHDAMNKSWNPPTEALQTVSLGANEGLSRPIVDGRTQTSWQPQGPPGQPPSQVGARPLGNAPVGLHWLNNEYNSATSTTV